MKRLLTAALLLCISQLSCVAQTPTAKAWQSLIDANKDKEAQKLCAEWSKSADLDKRIEAEKCLANVVLSQGEVLSLQGNDLGGGSLGEGYKASTIDEALVHLNRGLKLAPGDVSIYKGKLHLLEVAGRFDDMAVALDESCSMLKGKVTLDDWIAYPAELLDDGQVKAALPLLGILDKHFPNSHDVIGDFAAAYLMLKQYEKAQSYSLRAVELAPQDPIDTWNLARVYDFQNNVEQAKGWYAKALNLNRDPQRKKELECYYSKFVQTKLHDIQRGCKLQIANCEPKDRTACPSPSK